MKEEQCQWCCFLYLKNYFVFIQIFTLRNTQTKCKHTPMYNIPFLPFSISQNTGLSISVQTFPQFSKSVFLQCVFLKCALRVYLNHKELYTSPHPEIHPSIQPFTHPYLHLQRQGATFVFDAFLMRFYWFEFKGFIWTWIASGKQRVLLMLLSKMGNKRFHFY